MRKRYPWIVVLAMVVLVTALAVVSCGGDSPSTTAAPAGSTTTGGVATTAAGGTVDAAALYARDCGGCHKKVPGGGLDDVKSAIEKGKGDEMPGFADKLSAEEIAALAQWVANGGK